MKDGMLRAIRRHLIAGLVVIAPLGITAFVLWWIFQWLDNLLGRFLYPVFGFDAPGLGLLFLVVVLVSVGWVAERAIGARLLAGWNATLERVPLARRLYSASSRIMRTVFGRKQRFLEDVVLVEYPADGRWALGFLTAPGPAAIRDEIDDPVTVLVPTTPNPTTGWLVILPRSKVIPMPIGVDEAFTYLLSAGTVEPEHHAEPPRQPMEERDLR